MAAQEVVTGLVVGPALGLEVEGVGAEGDDAAGLGVQGAGVGVLVAVVLGEQGGAGAGPDRGGGRVFATPAEVNLALFEYIDGFYNSRRIQKRLGCLSPVEFEEKHYVDQATAERTNLKPRQPALTS